MPTHADSRLFKRKNGYICRKEFLYMKRFNAMSRLVCAAAGLFIFAVDGFAWGQKGHDVTCAIAEKHLSRKAKKQISDLLDGKSIVYWANWMDNASHTPEYQFTKTWHYKNIDADETYEGAALNENGDVVRAINDQIAALKSGKQSREEQILSLKFLVHLMGDLHCPMHMGHKSDLGGNRWQVQYFGRGTNLHSVWDSGLVESAHNWTYSEWVDQLDRYSNKENKKIAEGTPVTWGKETYEVSKKVYDGTPVGSKLSFDFVSEWTGVAETQLLRAGLRLAAVLNDIF